MFSNYAESTSSVVPEYSQLQHYYKNSQFGPKLPSTVPSMQYPTVQKLGNKWGYDALNHHSDGNEYYNVKNAYDSKCSPDFYVASCPSNAFVRPFPSTSGNDKSCSIETKPVVEGYQPTSSPSPSPLSPIAMQLKALDIVLFLDSSGKCPHSLHAMKSYKQQLFPIALDQVFMIKDLASSPHYEKELTTLGGVAIPFYFSRATHKSFTGFIPSLSQVIDTLHSKEHFDSPSPSPSPLKNALQKLKLKIYVSRGCGYCDHMKKLFQQHGVYDTAMWIDAHDPAYANELRHVRGFPYYMSTTTGKSGLGCPASLEKLIQAVQ